MSDIKRAILTTLEPQKVNDKAAKKQCKSVRICVTLPESNEDKCPEYNYKDELAAAKKKIKQGLKEPSSSLNGGAGADPFDNENDDDVRRIALEMEAKYGSSVTGGVKKRRRGRKDDYVDIGAGYDESDSFIDNTDGYDEIIPPNVTTLRGGFYINSGALEFKTDDEATSEVSSSSSSEDSGSEEDEKQEDKQKRKRPLDSTDEEDDGVESHGSSESQGDKKKNGDKPNISMHQAIKKKMFSTEKIQVKKQRLIEQSAEKPAELNSDNVDKDSSKENKKPMRLSSVADAIESVINRAEQLSKVAKSPQITKPEENHPIKTIDDRIAQYTSETEADFARTEPIKLPENLPADIVQLIENIKKTARNYNYKDGGRVKFFTPEVNNMFLNLECKCKILGRSSRVKVYEHLAYFVRCRKETLVKRAKNLVLEDEQRKLRKTIEKLKTQVDQLMPSLITVYEKECQRVLQKKFSQEAVNNEELKNLKAPRRRFPLTEDIKRMIRDIVSFKKRCYLHEGRKKDDLENLLADYLKKEILILWPEGWISMAVLKKFCANNVIRTPNPKATNPGASSRPPQKPPIPSSGSSVISFSAGSNLTITPVNLSEKFSNNNLNTKEKAPIEKRSELKECKENGVIVIHSSKSKEEPVIPKPPHCQIIDLTESISSKAKSSETSAGKFHFPIEHSESLALEKTLKSKYAEINIGQSSNAQNDIEDVQKVIDSLKALHKLSSPSKKEAGKASSVSVIALNKSYSNSSSSQGSAGAATERTNFTGSLGYQDEFQKQFIGSIGNLKSPPPHSSKSGYNKCS
ncbi:yemanuclein [Sitophilus oryzae]|uniref:Yemanuclein n=1 Tax=Sitophilus oryzae TaxID=7048 RepID=A0A6J2XFB7_SITOR|nr:yemanuclein [Sitophilus oryzae]